MRSSFFWDVTQRRMVLPYRRFGTIYRFPLQGSSITAFNIYTYARKTKSTDLKPVCQSIKQNKPKTMN